MTTVGFRTVASGFWEGKICIVEVALINLALIASTDMSPLRLLDRERSCDGRGSSIKVVSSGLHVSEGFKPGEGPGAPCTRTDDPKRVTFFEGECMSSASRFLFTPVDACLTPETVGELTVGGARLAGPLDTGVGKDLPIIDCD